MLRSNPRVSLALFRPFVHVTSRKKAKRRDNPEGWSKRRLSVILLGVGSVHKRERGINLSLGDRRRIDENEDNKNRGSFESGRESHGRLAWLLPEEFFEQERLFGGQDRYRHQSERENLLWPDQRSSTTFIDHATLEIFNRLYISIYVYVIMKEKFLFYSLILSHQFWKNLFLLKISILIRVEWLNRAYN